MSRDEVEPGEICEVCSLCIEDEALASNVPRRSTTGTCDQCGRSGETIDLDDLFGFMDRMIRRQYTPESESTQIPSARDFDWEVPSISSRELLYDWGDPLGEDTALSERFAEHFAEDWIDDDYWAGQVHERLSFGWQSFTSHVKFESRFVFLRPEVAGAPLPGEVAPSDMLDEIGHALREADAIVPTPAGQVIFRARRHARGEELATESDLGAPRAELTGAQRMSPPGISYFYGAVDVETCLAELRGQPGEHATVGKWILQRDIHLVDLDRVPEIPSLFDLDRGDARQSALFIRAFADEIRKPVLAGDIPAVDYVPTQAVAEYVRHVLRTRSGDEIGGIRYRSAAQEAGVNVVLFPADPWSSIVKLVDQPAIYLADSSVTSWKAM